MIPAAAAKLGDKKLGDPATELLLELASAMGPARCVAAVLKATEKAKSKVTAVGVLEFVGKVAEEFSAAALDLSALVDFIRVSSTDSHLLRCRGRGPHHGSSSLVITRVPAGSLATNASLAPLSLRSLPRCTSSLARLCARR